MTQTHLTMKDIIESKELDISKLDFQELEKVLIERYSNQYYKDHPPNIESLTSFIYFHYTSINRFNLVWLDKKVYDLITILNDIGIIKTNDINNIYSKVEINKVNLGI